MSKISCFILAYNEREKIVDAVSTVLWCDEIVLVDSGSTDGTAEAATALGARVVQVPFEGFGKLRNAALAHMTGDWIFSLDADERCTPEARDAMLRIASDPASASIWNIPRRNWFLGQWIRHSGWYPNFRQPQFFRRGAMTYDLLPVHEGWIPAAGAQVRTLPADIWQFPFTNIAQMVHKANRYSSLGTAKVGNRKGILRGLTHGGLQFFKHLILKRGFLDGRAGFFIAAAYFLQTFLKYAKRIEEGQAPPPSAGAIRRG